MPDRPKDADFNFSSMDWKAYVQFRPAYPAELYSIIYGYHDSHGGRHDAALDIGSGSGIVGAELLHQFSHVTFTDPSEAYISEARQASSSVPQNRVAFVQSKAETITIDQLPTRRQVDLVAAAECLHWMDLEVAVPRIANVLSRGGTFAGWVYGVRPILSYQQPGLVEATKLFYDIYDRMAHLYDTQIEKQDAAGGGAKINSRLDCLFLDSTSWENIRRIHSKREYTMAHDGWPIASSQVQSEEQVSDFDNQDILTHDANYEYLEGYLINWIPPLQIADRARSELADLKRAMNGRSIQITWPCTLILATRK